MPTADDVSAQLKGGGASLSLNAASWTSSPARAPLALAQIARAFAYSPPPVRVLSKGSSQLARSGLSRGSARANTAGTVARLEASVTSAGLANSGFARNMDLRAGQFAGFLA